MASNRTGPAAYVAGPVAFTPRPRPGAPSTSTRGDLDASTDPPALDLDGAQRAAQRPPSTPRPRPGAPSTSTRGDLDASTDPPALDLDGAQRAAQRPPSTPCYPQGYPPNRCSVDKSVDKLSTGYPQVIHSLWITRERADAQGRSNPMGLEFLGL